MKTPHTHRFRRPPSCFARRVVVLVIASLLAAAGLVPAQSAKGKPLKLKIIAPSKHTHVGDEVAVEIVCLDPENEAAPAPREYTVKLMVHMPSGKVDTSAVVIAAGDTSGRITIIPQEEGLLQLQAQHDRLHEGGKFLRVKPASARPKSERQPSPDKSKGESGGAGTGQIEEPPPVRAPASIRASEASAPLSPSALKPTITLRYSPQRTLLADGRDGASIQAFLLDEEDSLAQDIRVQLFNSNGLLQPQPLVIPAGESSGTAILTSQDVDTITVEYVQSRPATIVEGAKKLRIPFGPAIAQIVLDPSPAQITLVDECDLNVKLLNSEGRALKTDLPRVISFEIDRGRGEITNKEITIAPDNFAGRTTFRPTWRGQVALAATTPSLPASTTIVTVSLPTTLLLLTVAGGLAGGGIAYWREQNAKWWRVPIGLLTGFVLYWGFVFNLLPLVPRNVALNPLSALALSVIGGWLGTEVFNIILKKLGIGAAPAASK